MDNDFEHRERHKDMTAIVAAIMESEKKGGVTLAMSMLKFVATVRLERANATESGQRSLRWATKMLRSAMRIGTDHAFTELLEHLERISGGMQPLTNAQSRAGFAKEVLAIYAALPIDWEHVEHDALYAERIGVTDPTETLAVAITRVRAMCRSALEAGERA